MTVVSLPRPWDISSCYYKRFGPSRHYENTNTMNFGDNVGGITNPMVVSFDSVEVRLLVGFLGWIAWECVVRLFNIVILHLFGGFLIWLLVGIGSLLWCAACVCVCVCV